MARRVWVVPPTWNDGVSPSHAADSNTVVPPTWNDGVAPSHAADSNDKEPGKGRTGLRRLSIRRARSHDKTGEPGEPPLNDVVNRA